jgi:hypothetical protein
MTTDEARAILIAAFAHTPDDDNDMKVMLARLINPPPVRRKRWWTIKRVR